MDKRELNEVRLLINKGFSFTITFKRLYKQKRKTFTIKEPTLATLDKMSEEWVLMDMDESKLSNQELDVVTEAKKLVHKNTKRMAKVIALAVMGESYNMIKYRKLTNIFYKSIKPSQLLEISTAITTVSNLGDFVNSMRSMSAARTTRTIANDIE